MDLRIGHALLDQHLLHRLGHGRRAGEVVLEGRPALAHEIPRHLVHEALGAVPGLDRVVAVVREHRGEGDAAAEAGQRFELGRPGEVARGARTVEDMDVAPGQARLRDRATRDREHRREPEPPPMSTMSRGLSGRR